MTDQQAILLGQEIAHARAKKRWTLRQLAARTGIPHPWLAELERGHYHHPAPDRLAQLADLLGIPPKRIDHLMEGRLSGKLPELRIYFRTKYDLTPQEIVRVEDVLRAIYHERTDADGGND